MVTSACLGLTIKGGIQMRLINKIFGFSTRDLYLVELLRYDRVLRSEFYDSWSHYWYSFEPRK